MLPTIKFLTKQEKQLVNGSFSLYLRVTQNRSVNYIPLRVFVYPAHFDFVNLKCLKNHPDRDFVNKQIEFYRTKAHQIISDCIYNNREISFIDFSNQLLNSNARAESLSDYLLAKIEELKKTLAIDTYKSYKSQVTKLLQFRNPVLFSDITPIFLTKYKEFMVTRGNNTVTIGKSLSLLRLFTNWAKSDGLMKESPLDGIKIPRGHGSRLFLDFEELEKLEKIYEKRTLTPGKHNLLKVFLFACYTGIRFTDIKNLRYDNVKGDFVEIIQHKTSISNRIYIIDFAKKLLDKDYVVSSQFIFKFPCNQKANQYLKEIMKTAKIDKSISFHCARHTYATISLNLGIPIEVVSKGLGHTNITTTQIYAKLMDKTKVEQFSKWNNK